MKAVKEKVHSKLDGLMKQMMAARLKRAMAKKMPDAKATDATVPDDAQGSIGGLDAEKAPGDSEALAEQGGPVIDPEDLEMLRRHYASMK